VQICVERLCRRKEKKGRKEGGKRGKLACVFVFGFVFAALGVGAPPPTTCLQVQGKG